MPFPNILDPFTVIRLVDQLTVVELFELEAFIGVDATPEEYTTRASEWLRRRFPGVTRADTN